MATTVKSLDIRPVGTRTNWALLTSSSIHLVRLIRCHMWQVVSIRCLKGRRIIYWVYPSSPTLAPSLPSILSLLDYTMSSTKSLLVVLGATGNQGGSVLAYFLSLPASPYVLRGVTRDPSSSKSESLLSLGVEMVYGDIDHPASLDAAFKGASAIFSVTDFWLGFASASVREKAAAT